MAYRALSVINSPTAFESLVSSGQIADVFSLCFTSVGGELTLGGISPYYTGNISYIDITQETYYTVKVQNFLLDGVPLGYNVSNVCDSIFFFFLLLLFFFNSTFIYLFGSSIFLKPCQLASAVGC